MTAEYLFGESFFPKKVLQGWGVFVQQLNVYETFH